MSWALLFVWNAAFSVLNALLYASDGDLLNLALALSSAYASVFCLAAASVTAR